jgi:hypothetical protein
MLIHKGKGVTMLYLKKVTGDCIKPCLYLFFFCFLSLFLLFPGAPAQSGDIDLPQTGQTTCYDSDGDEVPCAGTGQDGDFLAGVAWPDDRFSVYNNCIIDSLTGLMWSRYAYITTVGVADWAAAASVNLSLCGLGDFRLPNINELQSLVNAEEQYNAIWLANYFYLPQSVNLTYWSSTTWAPDTSNAWTVNMIDGSVLPKEKINAYYFWPVRSHQTPVAALWKTGQTASFSNYDDGSLKKGTAWPDPRFEVTYCDVTGRCANQDADCDADSSNNIVTDNLTGLVWSANANLDGLKTWDTTLSFLDGLPTCGYGDWRLPDSKELFSLIDRSQSNPALPVDHPFETVQSVVGDRYWSSTSYASDPDMAWTMVMNHGALDSAKKTDTAFVWPVRGGQTKPYILTVKRIGDGQGKITAQGLTCVGKTCTGQYSSYEVVTITATAQTGSVFTKWEGCSDPTTNPCVITMTADTNITATFLPEYRISVTPKSLNFKNLKKDTPSASLSVTVTNVGVADLLISTIEIVEDASSVFGQTNDCPAALASNASCTITITATSPDYDQKTAELQIVSNDPKNPTTIVRLKAKAKPPKITKKPGSLNFGKVSLSNSADKTLTVTNKGVTDLIIGSCTITGDHPGDFSPFHSDTCSGSTLASGQTCTLAVTFVPSVTGKRSAILQIPSNDPKTPTLSVKLKGTGG